MSTRGQTTQSQIGRERAPRVASARVSPDEAFASQMRTQIGKGIKSGDYKAAIRLGNEIDAYVRSSPEIQRLAQAAATRPASDEYRNAELERAINQRTLDVLHEIRSFGPTIDENGRTGYERVSANADMRSAVENMPSDWNRHVNDGERESLALDFDPNRYVTSAGYRAAVHRIEAGMLGPMGASHELTHVLAEHNPVVAATERAYYSARAKSGGFGEHYANRTYAQQTRGGLFGLGKRDNSAHEVLSTGIEALHSGGFKSVDAEHRAFTVGMLAGAPGGKGGKGEMTLGKSGNAADVWSRAVSANAEAGKRTVDANIAHMRQQVDNTKDPTLRAVYQKILADMEADQK